MINCIRIRLEYSELLKLLFTNCIQVATKSQSLSGFRATNFQQTLTDKKQLQYVVLRICILATLCQNRYCLCEITDNNSKWLEERLHFDVNSQC